MESMHHTRTAHTQVHTALAPPAPRNSHGTLPHTVTRAHTQSTHGPGDKSPELRRISARHRALAIRNAASPQCCGSGCAAGSGSTSWARREYTRGTIQRPDERSLELVLCDHSICVHSWEGCPEGVYREFPTLWRWKHQVVGLTPWEAQ